MLRILLIVNPIAGIGGPAGLKGSDGDAADIAARSGYSGRGAARVAAMFDALQPAAETIVDCSWFTGPGPLGEQVLLDRGIPHTVLRPPDWRDDDATCAADTRALVSLGQAAAVDLVVFAGGDGTARDLVDAGCSLPVIGVPAGVKIQSGVYATSPGAAASMLGDVIAGRLLSVFEREVRDLDEEALRREVVRARHYGELWVPDALQYVQAVKQGGLEHEPLVIADIAAWLVELRREAADEVWLFGPGSTLAGIQEDAGWAGSLLGVDALVDDSLRADLDEASLFELVAERPSRLFVTAIGGQGFVFGRGNQQFSPRVIRAVGCDRIQVVATREKLKSLGDAPLRTDTGDPELDGVLSGLVRVLTGYDDFVLARLEPA